MSTDDGVWRDEDRLPLAELTEAMGTYSHDGQVDDPTGNDAGAEQEFGDELRGGPHGSDDADPTSAEGRRLRPSPDAHGPN
jgi:hypothetical protein